jgi:beta-lactamase regulating signal transducer with metallopeptidase domain/HEAT repeat protein
MPAIFSGDTASTGLSVLMILVKATLILLAALAVTRTMERGSAIARHLVWFVSLGSLLLIPALSSWTPIRLAILPAVNAPSEIGAPVGFSSAPAAPSAAASSSAETPAMPNQPRSVVQDPGVVATVNTVRGIVSPNIPWLGLLSSPTVLFAIWATVAVLFAGWLAWGALSVSRIIRRSRALDSIEWTKPLWEVADRLGLNEAPRLVRSEDAKMPFACGLLRPTIVLPAECDGWTQDRRRAVLLHELAHVRRRDLVGHTVGRFACALYWFHPLVWTAAKRLRSESERACDDLALNCGARASDYAEHLLDIVTGVRHHATPAVALAMARRKEFEGRMLAILDPELRRSAPSRKQTVGLVGGLAVLSLVLGAAVPVERAADGSIRPSGFGSSSTQIASDSSSFRDEEMAQSVRTVEKRQERTLERNIERSVQKATDQGDSGRRRAAEIGSEVGSAIGSAIAKQAAKSARKSVDGLVNDIVSTATSTAISTSMSSAASLEAAIKAGANGKQGRGSDDRPALLANVLKTDTSATLRRVAAWGLAQYADVEVASDALANALRRDADASVREMAAWALANGRGNSANIEALTTALRRDANVKVRATSAWALGSLSEREAVDELAAALSDTSRSVRYRAAWAIGSTEPKTAPKALIGMLNDKDADIRKVVAWALYNIQDPEAVPALDAAMQKETDRDVQRALIRAMASTGERSVDAIKKLIDSKDAGVREAAIRALAGGGSGYGPWPWPWPDPRPHAY